MLLPALHLELPALHYFANYFLNARSNEVPLNSRSYLTRKFHHRVTPFQGNSSSYWTLHCRTIYFRWRYKIELFRVTIFSALAAQSKGSTVYRKVSRASGPASVDYLPLPNKPVTTKLNNSVVQTSETVLFIFSFSAPFSFDFRFLLHFAVRNRASIFQRPTTTTDTNLFCVRARANP